jgi:hypothetical protein
MNVHLDQWTIPDSFEAVNLVGLDYEDIARAAFERLPVHVAVPGADKLKRTPDCG